MALSHVGVPRRIGDDGVGCVRACRMLPSVDDIIPTDEPGDLGRRYGDALAAALAADLATHPVEGPLRRVVIRWFWEGDPAYLTLHALGAADEQPADPGDEWYPLEWPDSDREFARTDRVLADPTLQQAASALHQSFEVDEDVGVPVDGLAHVPGVYHALRRLPEHLDAAGVRRETQFAAAAAHFEGWGCLHALEHTADRGLLGELRTRDALPVE